MYEKVLAIESLDEIKHSAGRPSVLEGTIVFDERKAPKLVLGCGIKIPIYAISIEDELLHRRVLIRATLVAVHTRHDPAEPPDFSVSIHPKVVPPKSKLDHPFNYAYINLENVNIISVWTGKAWTPYVKGSLSAPDGIAWETPE